MLAGGFMACESTAFARYSALLGGMVDPSAPPIAATQAARARIASRSNMAANVRVIPISGFLTARSNWISDFLGWSAYDAIGQAVDDAASDASVDAVVLDVDSGGGDVMGCQECADRIAACAQAKPMIAFADSFAASAAYWLSTQANTLLMLSSGQVGSVGVVCCHVSMAGANALAGEEVTYLMSTAAPNKAEGNEDFPLSPDAATYQQRQLDAYHASFAAAVARGRRTSVARVNSDFGGGRVLNAADAVANNLVDGTAPTLSNVVSRAAAGEGKPKRVSASASTARAHVARLEAEHAAYVASSGTALQRARLAELESGG
jgi:ClpP class serine protease